MKRLDILKTYKMYIGGAFPRTESGRYYIPEGEKQVNICRASRKDFRNAVVAAGKALESWSSKTAFNRSQIMYRIAEMLEGKSAQIEGVLIGGGSTSKKAKEEFILSVDTMVYYAGWCDKYQQIMSSINPVAGNYFNFSIPEPVGVVAIIADENTGLLGLINTVAPIIAGGNTCIVLASEKLPMAAIEFAEVLHTSDVPAGVVNILTGKLDELYTHIASHMNVNAICYDRNNEAILKEIQILASDNVKRVVNVNNNNWYEKQSANPYLIYDFQEIKTTWHPVESISVSGAGY